MAAIVKLIREPNTLCVLSIKWNA